MAIAAKVITEEVAPTHAVIPAVSSLHKAVPVSPSGCVKLNWKRKLGTIKTAYKTSATARFTRR